jgi:dCMP deaminase
MGYASGEGLEACRAVHAEQDAILQLPRPDAGGLDEGTLYCTTFPCLGCAKAIISSGLRKIVFLESYPEAASRGMLDEAGVVVEEFEGVKIQAFHKLFRRWD